nr:MAG TPA: hypothetical protein [Bacteriophage sp.]
MRGNPCGENQTAETPESLALPAFLRIFAGTKSW